MEKEVLLWQREGGKQVEDISEDTLWGGKESPENVSDEVLFETEEVKKDDAVSIEHTNDIGQGQTPDLPRSY